ncbi:DUF2141 domain-containing protein [Mangrovibacterium diazotrophicum]|uniref:Uncharacterized protein (DUF2141 family) n=1 Tax=Mangrovibacterium diazotrophicum TaxID=1261403 RepID=A0A419W5V6_9BACT|nr:DUF2141 domain-containing protein [Mangrovibacterium diazotrophicum]RKD90827.1 uncharacterized protein (DUF2141 family) [Mangrovibacterium diazotrophicum]
MKRIFWLLMGMLLSFTVWASSYELTIEVTNIKKHQGQIRVGVFDGARFFLEKGREFKVDTKNVEGDTVVFVFTNMTSGEYAVCLFHDEDSDGECNLNFLGIPKEPYGFSNNIRPTLSRPSFEECKIHLDQDRKEKIKLLY